MTFDGRKLYEVYDRKTGRMLASGDVASCARKLEIGMPGFRLAAIIRDTQSTSSAMWRR